MTADASAERDGRPRSTRAPQTTIRNQYGRLKFVAKHPRVLCVPTIKVRLTVRG